MHTPGHQPRRALFDDYPKACLASYPFPRDLCSSALFNTQPILALRTFHSQSRRQSRPLATILPIIAASLFEFSSLSHSDKSHLLLSIPKNRQFTCCGQLARSISAQLATKALTLSNRFSWILQKCIPTYQASIAGTSLWITRDDQFHPIIAANPRQRVRCLTPYIAGH